VIETHEKKKKAPDVRRKLIRRPEGEGGAREGGQIPPGLASKYIPLVPVGVMSLKS